MDESSPQARSRDTDGTKKSQDFGEVKNNLSPPPIFLHNVTDYKLLIVEDTKIIGNNFLVEALVNNSVKLTGNDPDTYHRLVILQLEQEASRSIHV